MGLVPTNDAARNRPPAAVFSDDGVLLLRGEGTAIVGGLLWGSRRKALPKNRSFDSISLDSIEVRDDDGELLAYSVAKTHRPRYARLTNVIMGSAFGGGAAILGITIAGILAVAPFQMSSQGIVMTSRDAFFDAVERAVERDDPGFARKTFDEADEATRASAAALLREVSGVSK